MNPYDFVLRSLFTSEPTGVENSALYCLLSLAADNYSSGFVRAIGRNEATYVIQELSGRFNVTTTPSPAILKLKQLCSGMLANA